MRTVRVFGGDGVFAWKGLHLMAVDSGFFFYVAWAVRGLSGAAPQLSPTLFPVSPHN